MAFILAIEHAGMSITTDPIRSKLMDMESEHNDLNNALNCSGDKYKKICKSMFGIYCRGTQNLTPVNDRISTVRSQQPIVGASYKNCKVSRIMVFGTL